MALPPGFIQRLRAIYPQEADAILDTFAHPRPLSFRINTLKTDTTSALDALRRDGFAPKPVAWYPYAFTLPPHDRQALARHPLFGEGDIYIQSLSSMLAPLLLAPEPGEEVLDLAAAPGGKSLMMAQMMENHGRIACVEPGRDRFFRMRANLERGGAAIARCYMHDGRAVGAKTPERFDRVLLDAPCSTEAKFRTDNPATTAYWSERKIREMAKLQWRLMRSALKALKPGGRLLYATCSFAPEENEAIVSKALATFEHIDIVPLEPPIANTRKGLASWGKKRFDPRVEKSVRILPDETMEGFFLCLLEKR
ncbi:RsmB/NOP family class I SAM-dependent RNA methyltransferase [Hydrogenimonas sp.]